MNDVVVEEAEADVFQFGLVPQTPDCERTDDHPSCEMARAFIHGGIDPVTRRQPAFRPRNLHNETCDACNRGPEPWKCMHDPNMFTMRKQWQPSPQAEQEKYRERLAALAKKMQEFARWGMQIE